MKSQTAQSRRSETVPQLSVSSLPDVIRELNVKDLESLGGLACYAIDSAVDGNETSVDINFLVFRPQIEWLESKTPIEQLSIAAEVVTFLKEQLMLPTPSLQKPVSQAA